MLLLAGVAICNAYGAWLLATLHVLRWEPRAAQTRLPPLAGKRELRRGGWGTGSELLGAASWPGRTVPAQPHAASR